MDRRRFLSLSAAAAAVPLLAACAGRGYDKVPADGVPRSAFDDESTAEQVTEGLDLTGKFAVVTGCTSGIGFETMRVLALRGAYVIGTSRSREYSDSLAYGHSKLANVLFSLELGQLLRGSRITSNALHPGVIDTEIDRNVSPVLQFAFGMLAAVRGKNVQQGAATTCYVATNPALGSTSGRYFEDCNAVTFVGDTHMQDMAMADRLWLVSEELTADHLVRHEPRDWGEFEHGLPRRQRER